MSTATMDQRITDARTEAVRQAADDIDHLTCDDCWTDGEPMLCGAPDTGGEFCPDDCGHPECPLCVEAGDRHDAIFHPASRWRRWWPTRRWFW